MVGIVVDELKLAAPGVVIGFGLDVAQRVGDDRRGLEMVREVVEDSAGRNEIAAGDAFAVEEDIFGFQRAGEIGFGDDARATCTSKAFPCCRWFS